jgi:ubiquinone/menaquinone biosynthesis C-methylase UbiE
MPTVEWNKHVWGEDHPWSDAGDEWTGMAAYCGQPYAAWKESLVETFITPGARDARVLEIAPGYGRWTEHLLRVARTVDVADINISCLDSCRKRFPEHQNIAYHLTDGRSLDFAAPSSIGFLWSFDSFVHMDPDVIRAYLREVGRVLAPAGTAIIHHSGKPDWTTRIAPITRRLGRPGRVLQRLLSQHRLHDDGCRSEVSPRLISRWATEAGLEVVRQTDRWGDSGQYTVAKYRDCITILRQAR